MGYRAVCRESGVCVVDIILNQRSFVSFRPICEFRESDLGVSLLLLHSALVCGGRSVREGFFFLSEFGH